MTKKLVSLFTSVCFLFSFIFAPAVEGAVDIAGDAKLKSRFEAALEMPPAPFGLNIPSGIGRITESRDCGSAAVVINIQDLHCQAEVQRNICRILETLDAKYGLQKVFVEGAAGDVDTSWLSGLADRRQRKAAADALLENGRLTGTEYYAIVNDRPGLLKGLEDEQLHKSNIIRLGRILERQPVYEQKAGELAKDLSFLEKKYFNRRNRKFNNIIEKYHAGKLTPRKYYAVLVKYAADISRHPGTFNPVATVRLQDYPNLLGYLALLDAGNRLRYKRAGEQLQGLLQTLKSLLPYSEYARLLKETDNFSQIDQTFLSLSPIIRKHQVNIEDRYPDLARLLAYIEQSRQLNPVTLIDEEKRLTSAVRLGLSQNVAELEVSFLADFFECFREYLFNRLSADDHRYFVERFDKFRTLWAKYAYTDELKEFAADFTLLDEFYAVNDERNECFLKNMAESLDATAGDNAVPDLKGKKVIVTVTGGFHTAGLARILEDRNISCVTLTPNVTNDAAAAGRIYAELARQQAQIFGTQSLQLVLTSHGARFVSANDREIVINVEGRDIRLLNKGGKFEIPPEEIPQHEAAGISSDVWPALQLAVNRVYRVVQISLQLQDAVNPLAMTKVLYLLTKAFGLYAAEEGFEQGDGLIWAIARDKNVQESIIKHEHISLNELANLIEPVQKAIAVHAVNEETVRNNTLARKILAAGQMSRFFQVAPREKDYSITGGPSQTELREKNWILAALRDKFHPENNRENDTKADAVMEVLSQKNRPEAEGFFKLIERLERQNRRLIVEKNAANIRVLLDPAFIQAYEDVFSEEEQFRTNQVLRYSVALSVARTMKRFSYGIDDTDRVVQVTKMVGSNIIASLNVPVIDKATYVLGIFNTEHNGTMFNEKPFQDILFNAGLSPEQNYLKKLAGSGKIGTAYWILAEGLGRGESISARKKITASIEQLPAQRDSFIYFSGHGLQDRFQINGYWKYITVQEIGDALVAAQKNGVDPGRITILFDQCYSYDFSVRLLNYLHEQGVSRVPRIVTAADKGTVSYLNRRNGTILMNALRDYLGNKKRDAITLRDFMLASATVEQEDPRFFLPLQVTDFEEIMGAGSNGEGGAALTNPETDRSELKKEVRAIESAILPGNRMLYETTMDSLGFLGMPLAQTIALWLVHFKEYRKIMTLSPAEFDRAHGSGNEARRDLAARMQAEGKTAGKYATQGARAAGAVALAAALTTGGVSLLAFAGIGLLAITRARTSGEWAGMLVTGVRHVRYDMQAEIPESQEPPVIQKAMPAVSKALAIVLLVGALFVGPSTGKTVKDDKEYEEGKVPFYDEKYGFDLRLYISAISHLVDMNRMDRQQLTASLRSGTLGKDLSAIVDQEKDAGFVFKPKRIDTLMKRQSGEQYQAIVEMLNNGFDAMGDAIGRFGRGVYQAIGMLEDDGDSLTFYTVPKQEEQSRYRITFTKNEGRIRVQFGYEKLSRTQGTGTEVILHKTKGISAAEQEKLEKYVLKKMGRSRRGPVHNNEYGDVRINNLKDFRHGVDGDGNNIKVKYRLGDKGVRYWFDKKGNLHIEDSGTGLQPVKKQSDGKEVSAILESLPVPYISTNRTGTELQTALRNKDWTANGEALFYRGKGDAKKTRITIEVGGTEAETIELDGSRLPDELVIDLPTAAGQLESRNQILLDAVTVAALKDIVDEYTDRFKGDPEEYAPVLNALSLLVSQLQKSNRVLSRQRSDNLERYLREKVSEAVQGIDTEKYVLVPNLGSRYLTGTAFKGKRYVYLNEDLWKFDPATIGGMQVSTAGKPVWKVAGMEKAYVRAGKNMILIRQGEYDYFMDRRRRFEGKGSVLLNLLFNMWSQYGRQPEREVEFLAEKNEKTETMAADKDRQARTIMNEIKMSEIYSFVRNSLESGYPPEKVKAAAMRLKDVMRLMPWFTDLLTRTVARGKKHDIEVIDGMMFVTVTNDTGKELHVIDQDGMVKTIVAGYNDIYFHGKAGGHLYVTVQENEYDNFVLYEIDKNFNWTKVMEDDDAEMIFEVGGYAYTVSTTRTLFKLNGLDKPEAVLTNLGWYKSMEAGINSYFAIRKQNNFNIDLYRVEQDGRLQIVFSGMDDLGAYEKTGRYEYLTTHTDGKSDLWAVTNEGKLLKVLSDQDRLFKPFEVSGQVYFKSEKRGKYLIHSFDQDTFQTAVISEDDDRSTPVNLNGQVYGHLQDKNNFKIMLYRFGHAGNKIPLISGKNSINNPVDIGGHVYVIAQDGGVQQIFEIFADDSTQALLSLPDGYQVNEWFYYDGQFYVQIVNYSTDEGTLLVRQGDRFKEIIPQTGPAIRYTVFKGQVYFVVYNEHRRSDLVTVDVEGNVRTIIKDKERISLIPGMPYVIVQDDGRLSTVPFDMLSQIATNGVLPDAEFVNSLSSGLRYDEESKLGSNLLRYAWQEEELKQLGWLLGYVEGRYVKRLSGPTRGRLMKYSVQEADFQRMIGVFMEKLGRQGMDEERYNAIFSRWLDLYAVDPERAEQLTRRLDKKIYSGNTEIAGWHLLKTGYAAEVIPDDQILISYLRGESRSLPLKAGERQVLPNSKSLGSIRGTLLSSLAGITQNLKVGPETSVEDVASALQGMPATLVYTENAIRRNVITTGHEWLRENIQNGVKALGWRQKDSGGKQLQKSDRTLEVTMVPIEEEGKTLFEVSTRDHGSGMNVAEILQNLLMLDESGYREGESAVDGFNGRGWYRNLNADRVRVISGKPGSNRYTVLEAHREPVEGGATWKADRFEEFEGQYEGTEMTWIREYEGNFRKNRALIELEAALVMDSLQKYVGMLPAERKNGTDITFNGKSIAETVKQVAKEKWNGKEAIEIVERSSGHTGVVQGGYFVMGLDKDPDLWALIPDSLKNFLAEEGLTLVLPSSIPLDRERAGLAEKNLYIERLQKAIVSVVLKAVAARIAYDVPHEIMYRPDHLRKTIPESLRMAAEINGGAWETINSEKLKQLFENPDKQIHLLMNLKVFQSQEKNELLSLMEKQREMRDSISRNAKYIPGQNTPAKLNNMIRETLNSNSRRALAVSREEDDKWTYLDPGRYTDAQKLLAELISGIMTPLLRAQKGDHYAKYDVNYGESTYNRHAEMGEDWTSLNMQDPAVMKWLSWIERYMKGETTGKEYEILYDIVEISLHEYMHGWEGSDEETHNDKFVQDMVSRILDWLDMRLAPEEVVKTIQKSYADDQRKLAAILGENVPPYLKTVATLRRLHVPEGIAKTIALWQVHFKEYTKIMALSPEEFDRLHGSRNRGREGIALRMQDKGRRIEQKAPPGFRMIGLGALFLAVNAVGTPLVTVAFAVAGLAAIVGARKGAVWVAKIATGPAHVRYGMKAGIPMAFFVGEDKKKITADLRLNHKEYTSVVVTTIKGNKEDLDRSGTWNLGIKAGEEPVWVRQEDGVLFVYVAGEEQAFADAASQAIETLQGYGNVRAYPRALVKMGVDKAENANAIIFDYTAGLLNAEELSDAPIVPATMVKAGIGAVRNLERAYRNAQVPETGVERTWSDELLRIERFNTSLIIPADELDRTTYEKVRQLRDNGAKVYVAYEGTDAGKAQRALERAHSYEVNGFFAPALAGSAMDGLAKTAAGYGSEFILAGQTAGGMPARRGFYSLDLSKDGYAQQIKAVQNVEYPVVKVTLGREFGREQLAAMKDLPSSSIIVFSAEDINRSASRDITDLEIFGANLLGALHLRPKTRAEKIEYQERVAYELDFGEFEVPSAIGKYIQAIQTGDFTAYNENKELLEAVQLHLSGEADAEMKAIFTRALVKRIRARIELALDGDRMGLEDPQLEKALADSLETAGGMSGNGFLQGKNDEEVQQALNNAVRDWENRADRETNRAKAAEIAGLLIRHADRRMKSINFNNIKAINLQSNHAILAAA